MSKPYILSVDDEDLNQEIVLDLLEDDFEISQVSNGQACLDSVAERVPELILLDVNMPGMDGLETCRKLRENDQTKEIPIIFLSALASPDERLEGYDAGGDDYVTKPFDEDELIVKIKLFVKQNQSKNDSQEQQQYAMNTAMTAMTSNSESGFIVKFMQDVFTAQNDEELSLIIFATFASLQLEGCLMLKYRDTPTYVFSDNVERPIEKEILNEAFKHSNEKIMAFSGRAILITEHAAVLIRRMPEDEGKAGRYRDHLAVFIDGLEEKLKQAIIADENIAKRVALEKTVEEISVHLEDVNDSLKHQRSLNTAVMGELVQDVQESFLQLGLEESQEETLVGMIEKAENKSDDIFKQGEKTEATFNTIIGQLHVLLKDK